MTNYEKRHLLFEIKLFLSFLSESLRRGTTEAYRGLEEDLLTRSGS